jgi:hypothetical protein
MKGAIKMYGGIKAVVRPSYRKFNYIYRKTRL